jgi:phenylpropionate dioxygenase-like ring-hydroxylating dioxygenase large terminal subunit
MSAQTIEIKLVDSGARPRTAARRDRRPWGEIEKEVAAGLRNHWYVVMPSDELPADKPVALRRMGEDIAVWRDAEGKVRVFADRCPHRGARLSMGRQLEGGLRCWYHGWLFDASGQCREIPSEGSECTLTGEVKVKAYPAEEHGGLVFVYFSSDGREPHEPCPNPYELESPEWNGFIVRHHWKDVPWFRAMDNLIDPLHAPFLHAGTYTLYQTKAYKDEIEVRKNDDGSYHVGRKGQALVNFDFTEYHFPNWFRLDIPYPWSAGPGGPMRILVMVCPIDENSSQVYMVRKRKITGWKWWLWKALWHVRLERKMWQVIDQDELILLSQRGRESLDSEYLVQGDTGLVTLRNLFREAVAKEKDAA